MFRNSLTAVSAALMLVLVAATTAAAGAKSPIKPKLSFVGQATCSEKTHQAFAFHLSGFTSNGLAMIIVRYPSGQFYWFHKNYGVVHLDAKGSYTTRQWACWYGPHGTMDPPGKYAVTAIDFTSNQTAAKSGFIVNP